MGKIISAKDGVNLVEDGMTVMIGGFLGVGTPENIIDNLVEKNVQNLTIISNDSGFPEVGIGKLIVNKQISKIITSHIGTNPETGRQMNEGETEVELVPQGTIAEQIRAAGSGLGGVLTPTGIGTVAEQGKKKIEINGKEFILELPLHADIALIKAKKADKKGNLLYNKSARNFNPLMAMAAKTVIAEVEEIVEVGEIDPEVAVTPGMFVNYIVKGDE